MKATRALNDLFWSKYNPVNIQKEKYLIEGLKASQFSDKTVNTEMDLWKGAAVTSRLSKVRNEVIGGK